MSTNSNRVSIVITAAQCDQFINHIKQASDLFTTPSLSSAERSELSTIGTRLQPFDDAVARTVPQFPQIVPPYASAEEATKDREARAKVGLMKMALKAAQEKLDDLDILLGADLYDFDHTIFYTTRDAVRRGGVTGLDSALNELEAAYPKRGKKAAASTPKPAP